jgi:hypothetical protein
VTVGEWVLLSYRVPREPSAPRIAIWRKFKRLGVAQLNDGLVGLPADARTREHLDWIADEVLAAGGTASVWLARPASARQHRDTINEMVAARAAEYEGVAVQAREAQQLTGKEREAAVRRLRAELHRIQRRDYFPPPEREAAQRGILALTEARPARARRGTS